MITYELGNVGAGNFLFPFNDKYHVAGKITPMRSTHSVDSSQTGDDLALVISDTTSENLTIANGRFKGWGRPQFERFSRLDIIMIIKEKSAFGCPFGMTYHDRLTGRFV